MSEISRNNSLKQYYFELKNIAQNALTLLNGINNAFNSYSPEVIIKLDGNDVRIPSFLYLENKIEELETTMNLLFNLPKSGEAWFTKEANMYKLNMVQSNVAPAIPAISYDPSNGFNIKENHFFKDLVSPKTYLKFDISNLPANIDQVLVKKIILHNDLLIEDIFSDNKLISYTDYKEKIYLMTNGVDYTEYDSKIDLPIKEIKYDSRFNIVSIPESSTESNPVFSDTLNSLIYKIKVDTLYYYNVDDHSIAYRLKEGDKLTLQNGYNIYTVLSVTEYADYDNSENKEYIIELQETNGHLLLTTTENNPDLYFTLYTNPDSINKNYVEISLEENPYIVVFVSSIYNNVRSNWSNGIKINLNEIVINDGKEQLTYIEYYNKYCKNLGDIIYSIGDVSYAQLSEYTNAQLRELTTGKTIKELVTNTLGKENNEVLNVTVINAHLVDDEISSNLASLHKQKIELNNELSNINSNIDSTYNQLINTDFSLNTSLSQSYLKSQLDNYYNERLKYQQQILSIINNIDLIKNDIVGYDELKHRVRGVTNAADIDESGTESEIVAYLKANYGAKCQLIGLEVEYKYKNINSNSSTLENNSNTLFTDWVRINNIEKQRYLKFDSITNNYSIEFTNYDTNSNIIKWNQIDIPISAGEDVVIRIRYKYSIGQPFINLYTPWSEEVTISYTQEDASNVTDISAILDANNTDLINNSFLKELINGGYQEHITNKIVDNSQVYFHMPENIYSGFNTQENKLISLKDKLIEMENSITEYKSYINNELNSEYKVFLEYDNNIIELTKDTLNTVNISNSSTKYDSYVRKDINLIIRNTGVMPINMYSIFSGNTEVPLLHSDIEWYNDTIGNYERVPLLIENINEPRESIFPQVLGQWIYFRQNNPFTKENIYNVNNAQKQQDINTFALNSSSPVTLVVQNNKGFISENNSQLLLGYRLRNSNVLGITSWSVLDINTRNNSVKTNNSSSLTYEKTYDSDTKISRFVPTDYNASDGSNFNAGILSPIYKYEHMYYYENSEKHYLNTETSIEQIIEKYSSSFLPVLGLSSKYDLEGAILIPNLLNKTQITCENNKNNQYKKINIGESVTIPLLLEYYFIDSNKKSITKTLAFDLKPSLTRQVDNYIFRIVVSNNIIDIKSTEYIPKIYSSDTVE